MKRRIIQSITFALLLGTISCKETNSKDCIPKVHLTHDSLSIEGKTGWKKTYVRASLHSTPIDATYRMDTANQKIVILTFDRQLIKLKCDGGKEINSFSLDKRFDNFLKVELFQKGSLTILRSKPELIILDSSFKAVFDLSKSITGDQREYLTHNSREQPIFDIIADSVHIKTTHYNDHGSLDSVIWRFPIK